jgi:hypothetical protein
VPAPAQSGVVLGGTAVLSAVNSITPHMSGAVDIMVVEQPDGSFKSTPFYGARSALPRGHHPALRPAALRPGALLAIDHHGWARFDRLAPGCPQCASASTSR